jgi:hypothetical protein
MTTQSTEDGKFAQAREAWLDHVTEKIREAVMARG